MQNQSTKYEQNVIPHEKLMILKVIMIVKSLNL